MSQKIPTDPLLSDPALCASLGVSKITIFRWRRRGILPPPIIISSRNYTLRSIAEKLKADGDGSLPQQIPPAATPAPTPKRRPAPAESV